MKWSWKMGEYAGIGVYVHATFFLLVAWIVLTHWLKGQSLAGTMGGVAFTLAIFLCVLLHEFGHALTAKKYGIKTKDITLLPIGGLARLERMPDDPRQELWVALAGPAVNVLIAAVLFVLLNIFSGLDPLSRLSVTSGSLLERLMAVNIFLALFNLLPAFPMDGGRVVRALLATRVEYTRATQIAASLGQGMAFLFGFIGLFSNPILLFISLFIWIGASQEAGMVQMKSALGGIPVGRAMITDFRVLSPDDTLGHAVDLILAGSQQDFPVVENGQVEGVLTRADLLAGLSRHGKGWPVADVMKKDIQVVDAGEMLESAFQRLHSCECHTIPVVSRGRLAGLITMENVGEFLMIQAALGASRKSPKLVLHRS